MLEVFETIENFCFCLLPHHLPFLIFCFISFLFPLFLSQFFSFSYFFTSFLLTTCNKLPLNLTCKEEGRCPSRLLLSSEKDEIIALIIIVWSSLLYICSKRQFKPKLWSVYGWAHEINIYLRDREASWKITHSNSCFQWKQARWCQVGIRIRLEDISDTKYCWVFVIKLLHDSEDLGYSWDLTL